MTDGALPLFHRICGIVCARGGGMTLEEIRDAAGLAEALVAADSRRIDAFASRFALSEAEVEEITESGNEHDGSATLAPGTTEITDPSTPQDSPRARTRVCGCLTGVHADRIRRPARGNLFLQRAERNPLGRH